MAFPPASSSEGWRLRRESLLFLLALGKKGQFPLSLILPLWVLRFVL